MLCKDFLKWSKRRAIVSQGIRLTVGEVPPDGFMGDFQWGVTNGGGLVIFRGTLLTSGA